MKLRSWLTRRGGLAPAAQAPAAQAPAAQAPAARAPAALTLVALTAAVLAGCGTTRAQVTPGPPTTSAASLPIATSLAGAGHADWAVAQLGGSSAHHDNFWELFVQPAGAPGWKLVTPPGVASNGGLILASTGTRLIAGFRPSQLLTFSPLATTTDQGKSWSQGNLVSPGLATVPDSLAAGPNGQLLALTATGTVRLGTHLGTSWRSVASRNSLARTAAGRACDLTSLSAVAFDSAGTQMVGGTCRAAGVVALFDSAPGGWQPTGLALPATLGHVTASVLGLAAVSGRTTALLAIGHGASAGFLVAWSGATRSSAWTFSPLLRTGTHRLLSQSLWPGGAAGLVLAGSRAETLGGPGASWRQLAPLPARTATLALGPAGQLEALTGHAGTVTAWQLGSGVTPASAGSGPASWNLLQTLNVQIPYGSSG